MNRLLVLSTHVCRNISFHGIHRPDAKRVNTCLIRDFHTSQRRNVAPFIWALLKPIIKLSAIVSGRSFRKWWQQLPPDRRQQFIKYAFSSRYQLLGVAGLMTGAGGLYYRSHIHETPITGRLRFVAFTDSQLLMIAKVEADVFNKLYAEQSLPSSHPYTKQVKRVVDTLLASNDDLQHVPSVAEWSINVIESVDRNAFVLPTGEIFVFTGLLSVTENDDQLSIVLGHELSHVLLSHAAEKISYAQLLDWLIIVAMAAIWAVMPTDGIAFITQWFYNKVIQLLFHMPYSRKLEKEADQVGLEICAKACYDVREGSTFWMKMSCLSRLMKEDDVPEMLSTHPLSENRAEHLDFIIPKAVDIRNSCKCPQLSLVDPRNKIKAYQKMTRNEVAASRTAQDLRKVSLRMSPNVISQTLP